MPHLFRNVDFELIRLIGFQNKATFTWDTIWKMTEIKFQTSLSFASVYMKK